MAKLHDTQKRYKIIATHYDYKRVFNTVGMDNAKRMAVNILNTAVSDPIYAIRVEDIETGETVF